MDGVELEQSGDSQGTIPLVDDRQDHYVEVEFGGGHYVLGTGSDPEAFLARGSVQE